MKDHLKFAMSYWHTLVTEGVDMFGDPTNDKSFNEKYPLSKYKASGQVIIEPNNKYLSFKFHKTGINVYSIKVTKHG